ncbi:restriction endonuclease subunit S [Rhizobium leguminosarum]
MSGPPRGWIEERLSEVCELITDGTHHSPSNGADGEFKYVTAKNIRKHGLDLTNITYVDAATHREIYKRCPVQFGDVLYIKDGATTGLAIVNPLEEEFSMLSSVALLRPVRQLLDAHFLRYQLNTRSLRERMTGDMTGSAIRRLTLTTIGRQAVNVPSLAEQKRIVAKLDALNAKSARARTELARIETLVSRYKQAVLSKAFSGELLGLPPTATQKPHTLCWDLPPGWRWVAFEDAVEIASNLVKPESIPDLPHIAPDNIESGTTRLLPFRTIREDGMISGKHRFYPGQVLYSKIRPYLRKAVIVDFDGACSADMYPLSPRQNLSGRYLLRWLVGEQFTQFAIEHQGRTVLPKINQSALNKTPLPLPPLAEQHEIVRRIESAFAKIDRLAAEAKRALELVGRLDEAILSKAFRGELVPQNENDEPAEKLLERIRAERAAAPKEKARTVRRKTIMLTAKEFLNAKLQDWPEDGVSFQDLRAEYGGSYDDLKDAIFASLSDAKSTLHQVFDENRSLMTIRKRQR